MPERPPIDMGILKTGMDEIKQTCSDLRTTCEFIQTEVSQMKSKVSQLESDMEERKQQENIINLDIDALDTKVEDLEVNLNEMRVDRGYIDALEQNIDRLESYSRRDNVIFYGIGEEEGNPNDDYGNESYAECKKKVLKVLQECVWSEGKVWNERDIVRAHRIRKSTDRPLHEPRPLIARFLHWDDKMLVTQSKEDLQQAGYKTANDLTYRQRKKLRELKSEGKKGYFQRGKLIIQDDNQDRTQWDRSATGESSDLQRNPNVLHRDRVFTRRLQFSQAVNSNYTGRDRNVLNRDDINKHYEEAVATSSGETIADDSSA